MKSSTAKSVASVLPLEPGSEKTWISWSRKLSRTRKSASVAFLTQRLSVKSSPHIRSNGAIIPIICSRLSISSSGAVSFDGPRLGNKPRQSPETPASAHENSLSAIVSLPPNRGGKIRPFHMIEHLGRNRSVVVASLLTRRRNSRKASLSRNIATK